MKRNILIISFLLIVKLSNAQTTFQKAYGGTTLEYARCMSQTSDSGYIIASYKPGNLYLLKLDANANFLWNKFYVGNNTASPSYVQQTLDGGYIIGGGIQYSNLTDALLIKTDSTGIIQWSKVMSTVHYDGFNSIKQTPDSGYICTGLFDEYNGGWSGVYLLKTNAYGDTLWTKAIRSGYASLAHSLQLTNDGGFIITGSASISGSGDRVYLLKTDSLGNPLWAKTYGGSSINTGTDVKTTTDGGYIITGQTYFGAGNDDVYLIKTDSVGDVLWTKTYGGPDHEYGASVLQTNDGGYIVGGFTTPIIGTYKIYIIKTNTIGDTLWTKTITGVNTTSGDCNVIQASDGGYVIMADCDIVSGNAKDIILIKIDSLGNSSCNMGNTPTTVTSPPFQVASQPTSISAGGIITQPVFTTSIPTIVSTIICQNTSISENTYSAESFNIYPNPSNGHFIISFEQTTIKGKIEILSILTEIVFTDNISHESTKEIRFDNISSGVYFVKVFDEEKSYWKKIIIE